MRTETASVTAPLPVFGLRGLWEIAPKWYIDAQAQYFTLEIDNIDGEVTDLRAGITWMFAKHWGLGAGYNRFVTDVECRKTRIHRRPEMDLLRRAGFHHRVVLARASSGLAE